MLPAGVRQMAAAHAAAIAADTPIAVTLSGGTMVLPIEGLLAPRGMYAGGTSYEAIADRVREAAADKRIMSIVLDMRSPGGTVWGCAEAADAIYDARQAKPVIAVANPYCFSAAYWLATQASRFYVTKSGEVGSVGVRSGHTDMSGLEDKIGIKTTLIASSPDKIAGHPHAPLADDARAEIQRGVDEASRQFMLAIARGRGMRLADVAVTHGTGKTFSAQRALAQGMVDGVMTLRDAVAGGDRDSARKGLERRRARLDAVLARLT